MVHYYLFSSVNELAVSPSRVTQIITPKPTTILPEDCQFMFTKNITSCTATALMTTTVYPQQCSQATTQQETTGNDQQAIEDVASTKVRTISIALGSLIGIMALGLVGVVLGWVCSCHRKRGKSVIEER